MIRNRWLLAGLGAGVVVIGLVAVPLLVIRHTSGGPDTAAPNPPGAPTATAVGITTVDLTWGAATDNVGVVGYQLMKQGQQLQTLGNVFKTQVVGLTPNTDYVFTVGARDAAGNVSQDSAEVKVHTLASNDKVAPVVPGGLRVSGTGPTTVTLAWNPAADNPGGVGLDGYNVYVNGTKTASTDTPTATVGNLKAGTNYMFQVTALDLAGNESGRSGQVTGTPKAGAAAAGGTQPGAVKQVAADKDVPWGLAFLPDGSGLYTERDAFTVVKISPTGQKTTVGTVPGAAGTEGEGGVLGLELSPNFATDHWVYIYHTTSGDNRIVRLKLNGNSLDTGSLQVLVKGIGRNKFHNGGRLRFGPDGNLYASTGDAQNGDSAQNTGSLNGKILRIAPDGKVPAGNPFGNYVWSYGHRNVQGLAFDSRGQLWEAEFGNSKMDELNLIRKGGNYGWPACEGTSGDCGRAGFVKPVQTWGVAQASPSGLAIVRDTLYMAALRGERLWVMSIAGTGTSTPKAYFQGQFGRMRTVEPSPDGGLWVTTSNGDKDSTANNSNTRILHIDLV
jgi:glucose/arabinose dehydrogenase